MQTVVLDTNALLMPFEMGFNLDLSVLNLLGNAIFVIPRPLIGELRNLKNKYAPAALRLAENYEIIPTKAIGDDSVIELALKTKGYVLTNDKILRKRLKKLGLGLIYLRSSTHLVVEEGQIIQK
ncbi:MAG: twitching motility protein PilT [archaeon]|nr:twitching motility protein PilT [archaeon]